MQELFEDFPLVIEHSIAWRDMDAFQHVNNATYFTYFESARIAYFEKIGVLTHMQETQEGPILASTQCRFKRPLKYPDTIFLCARTSDIQADRFTMQYRIVGRTLQAIAAEGEGKIVYFNYATNKKSNIPATIRNAMVALESEKSP